MAHSDDDVQALALKASRFPDVDMHRALRQIAGRQAARQKIQSWAAVDGIEYPARLSLEQCSSDATAAIKKQIIERIINEKQRLLATDLTGGLGVDFTAIAPLFKRAVYVEQNEELCRLAKLNFPLLGISNAEIVCCDSEEYLKQMPAAKLIYADPARRSTSGSRTYAIADSVPNIVALLPSIMQRCQWFVVKLSPMLDLNEVASELKPYVTELHVVESEGECKEIVAVCQNNADSKDIAVYCHTPYGCFSMPLTDCGSQSERIIPQEEISSGLYVYLPTKALSKVQCFRLLERKYLLRSVARDSHVFMSSERVDFPGRCFIIESVGNMNKQQKRTIMSVLTRANITVRNFPLRAEQLRNKLHLKDGGDAYIIATTDTEGQRLLLICKKASD